MYVTALQVCEDPNSVGFGRAREIELQDFKSLMGKLGKVLFPSDSQEGARESRSKLTARVLIPYLTKEDARRFKHLVRRRNVFIDESRLSHVCAYVYV